MYALYGMIQEFYAEDTTLWLTGSGLLISHRILLI